MRQRFTGATTWPRPSTTSWTSRGPHRAGDHVVVPSTPARRGERHRGRRTAGAMSGRSEMARSFDARPSPDRRRSPQSRRAERSRRCRRRTWRSCGASLTAGTRGDFERSRLIDARTSWSPASGHSRTQGPIAGSMGSRRACSALDRSAVDESHDRVPSDVHRRRRPRRGVGRSRGIGEDKRGRGRARPLAHVFTVRDGKSSALESIWSASEALEAAGLSE